MHQTVAVVSLNKPIADLPLMTTGDILVTPSAQVASHMAVQAVMMGNDNAADGDFLLPHAIVFAPGISPWYNLPLCLTALPQLQAQALQSPKLLAFHLTIGK